MLTMAVTHTVLADGGFDILIEKCPTRQVVNWIGDRWSLCSIRLGRQYPAFSAITTCGRRNKSEDAHPDSSWSRARRSGPAYGLRRRTA